MLDTGVSAYNSGKVDQAIRAFDTAIRNGGLSNQQMASALYYRGMAYRKKGKPALAIPDLTSAVWLNDGLTFAQRQDAMNARAAAYNDAGVSDVPAANPVGGNTLGGTGWQTAMTDSPATASAPAPVSSPPPPQASAPVSAPQTAAYVPARPPPPPPPETSSGSSGGGFFSSITNMFGGGSSSSAPPKSEVTTSSIVPPPPAPAVSAWSQSTQVAAAPAPAQPAPPPAAAPPPPPVQQAAPARVAPQTQVAAVAPPIINKPAPSTVPSGKYHVQIAAVRSRSEADALSVRLISQYGSEFGPRRPAIKETVIGSMGTFYRVSVGPFASEKETARLCGSLRSNGFDCLVITQ